jgi:hypothetical protein
MWMRIVAIHAQETNEPTTIDPRPILLIIAVAMVAYVIVTHIKEILIFLAVVAVALMLLGVFQLKAIVDGALETTPTPAPVPISDAACISEPC